MAQNRGHSQKGSKNMSRMTRAAPGGEKKGISDQLRHLKVVLKTCNRYAGTYVKNIVKGTKKIKQMKSKQCNA